MKLGIVDILMTIYESRMKLYRVLTESLQEQRWVFETRVPSRVKVEESQEEMVERIAF